MSDPAAADPAVIAPAAPADRSSHLGWRLLPPLGCGLLAALQLHRSFEFALFTVYGLREFPRPLGWEGRRYLSMWAWEGAFHGAGAAFLAAAAVFWWRDRRRWAVAAGGLGIASVGIAFAGSLALTAYVV